MFKVIVFLGIQLWVVEQTCKTEKWNQGQEFESFQRLLQFFAFPSMVFFYLK